MKRLISLILLFTTPSISLYPQPFLDIPISELSEERLIHLWSFDEIIDFLDRIESGELEETCTPQEFKEIVHFLILLVRQGALFFEDPTLESDIEELLLMLEEYPFTSEEITIIPSVCNKQIEFILCKGWWSKTKSFFQKHKTVIIVGTVCIVAAPIIAYSIMALPAAGAAIGGALKATESKPSSPEKTPSKDLPPLMITVHQTPVLQEAIEENIACALSPNQMTFIESMREFGSVIAHETLEALFELALPIADMGQNLVELFDIPQTNTLIAPEENYKKLLSSSHQTVDELFNTNQASAFTPSAKQLGPDITTGVLPPPGQISKGPKSTKFKKFFKQHPKASSLANEETLSSRQITELQATKALEKNATEAFERGLNSKEKFDSLLKYKKAENFLEQFKGKNLTEVEAKQLINQCQIETFPRPAGIPEDYIIKFSNDGAGIKYVDPSNVHTYVRVMPGKPHSPNPYQQKPYINQRINGNSLDKYGKFVKNKSAESHIPINEYKYRSKAN